MKSRTFLSLLLGAVMFGAAGCDVLDVQPEQSISSDEVFKTPQSARAAVVGMYDALQGSGSWEAMGGLSLMAADFSTDNTIFSGSFDTWHAFQDYTLLATNAQVLDLWQGRYVLISRANAIIENIGEAGLSEAEADQYRGEAKFLRALAYHDLLRWFARPYVPGQTNDQPGVPLVLKPTTGPNDPQNELPRASVEEVYAQIVRDLEDALTLVPSGGALPRVRANAGAISALLARVHLYMGHWQQAADYAQAVLDMPNFELLGSPMAVFATEENAEIVFGISFSSIDNPGTNDALASFYLPGDYGGRGDISVSPSYLEAAEPGDLRVEQLVYQYKNQYWTSKWDDPNFGDDVPVFRLAEVLLIRAEALAELGQNEAATGLINRVRGRAGLSPLVYGTDLTSTADVIDAVLHERRMELAFEGHRRHDLLRRGRNLRNNISASDPRAILPIPASERDVNPNITQNPGY